MKIHTVSGAIMMVFLFMSLIEPAGAQKGFTKPSRRSVNQLDISGPYLKTIYSFTPAFQDTIPRPGTVPLLVSRYQEQDLLPTIFEAVFSGSVKVYDPNFWGPVPQLVEQSAYREFDTLRILDYLSAGWDTSLIISSEGNMEEVVEYRDIPYHEISGLLFFESWWLDEKSHRLFKDVFAYLPIREYLSNVYDGHEESEIRRRLIFMIIPEWSTGSRERIRYNPRSFLPAKKDLQYEVKLYNKAYHLYLYRDGEYGQISRNEYEEWQYHYFDFYRHFDANRFLEIIISEVLAGHLKASLPEKPENTLKREEFIDILKEDPFEDIPEGNLTGGNEDAPGSSEDLLPGDYPLGDLNSVLFHEDWYIHPQTLQIFKDVKGITVNRTYTRIDEYTGDFLQETSRPLFTVWFR